MHSLLLLLLLLPPSLLLQALAALRPALLLALLLLVFALPQQSLYLLPLLPQCGGDTQPAPSACRGCGHRGHRQLQERCGSL